MRLLTEDKEFIDAIQKVAELSLGLQLRKSFVTLLISNAMSNSSRVELNLGFITIWYCLSKKKRFNQ